MKTHEIPVVAGAGPADMIATVWFNLGYRPRDSLVVLGLEGPRNRVGVLLRGDLPRLGRVRPGELLRPIDRFPPDRQLALLPDLVRDLLSTVATSGAHSVLAVVADDEVLGRRSPAVVRALRQGAREFRLELMDVLGVTATAFRSLVCHDPRCCPRRGRPIAQVMSSRGAALHVVVGDTVVESEADLHAVVTPGPADFSGSGDPPWDDPESGSPVPGESTADKRSRRWLWWQRWQQACATAAQSLSQVGLLDPLPPSSPGGPLPPWPGLSAALHDWVLRDAVLLSLLGGVPSTPAMMDDDDQAAARELARNLDQLLRRCPDPQRLIVARTVLAGAVRVAAEGDRGPALALLGLIAWFEGRGARARLLIERAQADAPSVSLSGLVQDLLVGRVPPPWRRNGPEG